MSRGLTDDVLTLAPRARSTRVYFREGVDQLAGADPGLTQLRLALQAVLSIAGGVTLAYAFVKLTGALQLSPSAGPAAVVHAGDHALLVVAMLIAGMVAMMAGFTVSDTTARGQVLSTLYLPIPMLAAMSVGIALGPYRVPSLIWLVVLLATAVYIRRFGPRGTASGLVMFNGGFLGFFLHAQIHLRDIGWLAALLGMGVLASLTVRFALFRPNLIRTLARMRRSWEARANRLLALSMEALAINEDEDDDGNGDREQQRRSERLRRQLVQLNECTLMIDAQLAESVPDSAGIEAQRLFDADLALSNIARFAGALGDRCKDEELRRRARLMICEVLYGTRETAAQSIADLHASADHYGTTEPPRVNPLDSRMAVAAHRLAGSAESYLKARAQLRVAIAHRTAEASDTDATEPDELEFIPAVTLNSGWLPGSGPISTQASTTPGRGGALDRAAMPPYVRASIQVAVAATIAIIAGDLVSSQRLYWAVLATFLAFMATTNSGEQVRKALFRVGGTAIGIVIGDLLVHLTGGHILVSLIIVVISLFFGIYLVRVNYTFMVIGITVTLSQLYAQLDEFSWHLLLLRLAETAIGVGAVVLTVLLVIPLRPQRVLITGILIWFQQVSELVNASLDQLVGTEPDQDGSKEPERTALRPLIRDVDAAFAGLEATAEPLRRATFGRNSAQLTEIRSVSSAARNYARSFAVGVEAMGAIPDDPQLRAAVDQLRASMAAIEGRVEDGSHGIYTRSAALVELASRALAPDDQHAILTLRDLTLLDGTLARLAVALQMTVVDYETSDQDQPISAGTPG